MQTNNEDRTVKNLRFYSKSGKYIALIPLEALDPTGRAIGFSVVVTADGVSSFKASWPCSRLGEQPIRFEFASNGDLVDVSTARDGEDLLALSQDAQEFGEKVIEKRRAVLLNSREYRDGRNQAGCALN